jgi:hypothetical protein
MTGKVRVGVGVKTLPGLAARQEEAQKEASW